MCLHGRRHMSAYASAHRRRPRAPAGGGLLARDLFLVPCVLGPRVPMRKQVAVHFRACICVPGPPPAAPSLSIPQQRARSSSVWPLDQTVAVPKGAHFCDTGPFWCPHFEHLAPPSSRSARPQRSPEARRLRFASLVGADLAAPPFAQPAPLLSLGSTFVPYNADPPACACAYLAPPRNRRAWHACPCPLRPRARLRVRVPRRCVEPAPRCRPRLSAPCSRCAPLVSPLCMRMPPFVCSLEDGAFACNTPAICRLHVQNLLPDRSPASAVRHSRVRRWPLGYG